MPSLSEERPPTVTGEAAGAARSLYRHRDLRRLIHPESIAVFGASNRTGSFGLRTLNNLAEFDGRLYAVNPNYDRVGAVDCFASVQALPEVPDCVVVAVNRDLVLDAVRASVEAGAGGVIVYAGGFAETARADLIALQRQVKALVEGTPTRLIGPNCLGITNYARGARILFGRMPVTPKPRPEAIAIVSQSGSVSMALGQAVQRGVAISHAIPVGNAADVGIADLIAYLAEDSACSAIACVFEGVDDPPRLIEAAQVALERDKPLVVYKMAVGEQGAAAALSHTGALAGAHELYRCALESVGAVMVESLEDVIETTAFMAKAGRPRGRGVAVVLGSGGLGVIAADKAEQAGVALPQPEGRTLQVLQEHVPEFGAARNPCDVTAQALNDEGPMRACAHAMLADSAYGALLVVHPYADPISSARVPLWAELAQEHDKIVCNYWATEALEGHGVQELEAEPRIATFRSLGRCFRAIAAWHARQDRREERLTGQCSRLSLESVRVKAAALLGRHAGAALTERAAKELLALYGVPVVSEQVVQTQDDAVAAARRIGFPVVLKIESPDVLHKTESGLVRLGLRDELEVRQAAESLLAKASAMRPAPRVDGVLVQPMIAAGLEIMMGARIDPQFGPMVVVGLGGILVELLKDSVLAPAPVSPGQALRLLQSLRAAAVLSGFRGMPGVDRHRLAEIIARFSEFVADHASSLREVDVNPLICRGEQILAVDALIVTAESSRRP